MGGNSSYLSVPNSNHERSNFNPSPDWKQTQLAVSNYSRLILVTLIQTQYEDSDLDQLDQLVSRGNLMMRDERERERERLRVENEGLMLSINRMLHDPWVPIISHRHLFLCCLSWYLGRFFLPHGYLDKGKKIFAVSFFNRKWIIFLKMKLEIKNMLKPRIWNSWPILIFENFRNHLRVSVFGSYFRKCF